MVGLPTVIDWFCFFFLFSLLTTKMHNYPFYLFFIKSDMLAWVWHAAGVWQPCVNVLWIKKQSTIDLHSGFFKLWRLVMRLTLYFHLKLNYQIYSTWVYIWVLYDYQTYITWMRQAAKTLSGSFKMNPPRRARYCCWVTTVTCSRDRFWVGEAEKDWGSP